MKSTKSSITFYPSIKLFSSLRRKAYWARNFSEDDFATLTGESGTYWYKSPVDPMKLFRVFKRLSLKSKYTLRAYVYYAEGNGNSIVWGMPNNSVFPEPEICQIQTDNFQKAPRPPDGVPVEDILEGNNKPWSYLEASLFLREMYEFGACWHGCFWSDVDLICQNPFDVKSKNPTRSSDSRFNPHQWKWCKNKLMDWRPKIILEPESVRVLFYVYNPVGRETIELKEDLYEKGCYKPQYKKSLIAEGPGGIIY